jgi:uncharacterized protein YndB with AHSA1/START domain
MPRLLAACNCRWNKIMEGTMLKGMRANAKNQSTPGKAVTRREVLVGTAGLLGCLSAGSIEMRAGMDEISHACEAIHQEVVFNVAPKRVYEALTDAKQFSKVVMLSAAVQTGMASGGKPVEVSPDAGGAFSAFGGYITGRHIELVPNERIVQAWRASGWEPGQYSIAKFVLSEQGSGTKLVFDHTGFPEGKAPHLAEGWRTNYWEPMAKYFGQG